MEAQKKLHKIGVLYNPISGSGRGKAMANSLAEALTGAHIQALICESQHSYEQAALLQYLRSVDALLVVGGDGTIRTLLGALSESQVPAYLVPCGNESLFARHFGMSRLTQKVLQAVTQGKTLHASLARINESFFFNMASLGLDSLVVERIARSRRGPIGHIGYVMPTLKSLSGFSAPQLTVSVDGKKLVNEEPGFVIAANTSQYARNLRLVPEATGNSVMLHVRFFPYRTISHYLPWIWSLAAGRPVSLRGSTYASGKNLIIETGERAWPIQADGEHVGETPARIDAAVERLTVLSP
jgi:diacylglycerol kinase family enzyme